MSATAKVAELEANPVFQRSLTRALDTSSLFSSPSAKLRRSVSTMPQSVDANAAMSETLPTVSMQPGSVSDVLDPGFAQMYAIMASGGRNLKNLDKMFRHSRLPKPWGNQAGCERNTRFRRLVFRVIYNLRSSAIFNMEGSFSSIMQSVGQYAHSTTLKESNQNALASPKSKQHSFGVSANSFRQSVASFPVTRALSTSSATALALRDNIMLGPNMFGMQAQEKALINHKHLFGKVCADEEHKRFFDLVRALPDLRDSGEVEFVAHLLRFYVPFFADMPIELVKVFSVEMRAEYFELGQSIFSQGDAADKFYVIVSGTVDMKEAKSTGFSYTVATLRATNSIGSFMLQNEFDGSMPASPVLQGSPTNKSGNSNSSHRSHKSWNRSQSSREHTAQCMSDVCVLSVGRGAYQRLKSIRANQTKQRTGYLQRRLKLPFFADHDRHSLEQLSAKIKAHCIPSNHMLIQQGNVCNRVFVVTRGEIAIYRVISMPKSWRQTHSRTFMALRTIDQASSLIVTPLRLLAGSMLRNEFTPSAAVPVMVEAPLEDDSDSDADDEEHFVSSPFEPSLDHSDAECESVLVQVDTLLPGDVLGFLPSAEGGREISSFYAVARTECDVFCVSADHVLEFVDVATRMRLSNHFAEQRVDERSVMLHVLQQKAWQEFSQASVQAAHVEVAPESIRTGVNANTFNLQPPVHVAAPDEDAIRFDFSVCQGVLPSQNQIQSIEQLYQSFDPRTAAKLAVEHATQKMSHESVRAVLSPTASQVAAERGFRSTANQLPARKEVIQRANSLKRLKDDLHVSRFSSGVSPSPVSPQPRSASPLLVDSDSVHAPNFKSPSLRERSNRYPPDVHVSLPSTAMPTLSELEAKEKSFGGLPAALKKHYSNPALAAQAFNLSYSAGDAVANSLSSPVNKRPAPLMSPKALPASPALTSPTTARSPSKQKFGGGVEPIDIDAAFADLKVELPSHASSHQSHLHPKRPPFVPINQRLLSSTLIPDLFDLEVQVSTAAVSPTLWQHAPKAGGLMRAGDPTAGRSPSRAFLTTSTFTDPTRNVIPFSVGRSTPDLALRHRACAHSHETSTLSQQVAPQTLSAHFIEHSATFDRGSTPGDAPDFMASKQHFAHSGWQTGTTLVHTNAELQPLQVNAKLATAAQFLVPQDRPIRAVGSEFSHSIQRASAAISATLELSDLTELAPSSPQLTWHSQMRAESLSQSINEGQTGGEKSELSVEIGNTPAAEERFPEISAPLSPSDPDTKLAWRRATEARAASIAAAKQQLVDQTNRDRLAVARRHQQQLESMQVESRKTSLPSAPLSNHLNRAIVEHQWIGNLRAPHVLTRVLKTDFPLQLDPMSRKFKYTLPPVASPLAAAAQSIDNASFVKSPQPTATSPQHRLGSIPSSPNLSHSMSSSPSNSRPSSSSQHKAFAHVRRPAFLDLRDS